MQAFMAATAWLPKEKQVLMESFTSNCRTSSWYIEWMVKQWYCLCTKSLHYLANIGRSHCFSHKELFQHECENYERSTMCLLPNSSSLLCVLSSNSSFPLSHLLFLVSFFYSPHSYHLFTHLSWSTHIPLHPSPHISGNLSWAADSYAEHQLVFLFTAWPVVQVSECNEALTETVCCCPTTAVPQSQGFSTFLHGTLSSWLGWSFLLMAVYGDIF